MPPEISATTLHDILSATPAGTPDSSLSTLQEYQAEAVFIYGQSTLRPDIQQLVQERYRNNRVTWMRINTIQEELASRFHHIPYWIPDLKLHFQLLGFPHWLPIFAPDSKTGNNLLHGLKDAGFKPQTGIPLNQQHILPYNTTLKRNSFYVSVRNTFRFFGIPSTAVTSSSDSVRELSFFLDLWFCSWLLNTATEYLYLHLLLAVHSYYHQQEHPNSMLHSNQYPPLANRLLEELVPGVSSSKAPITAQLFESLEVSIVKKLYLLYRYKSLQTTHMNLIFRQRI